MKTIAMSNFSSLSYSVLIETLFKINVTGGMKLGLQNMEKLVELLDFPNRTFQSIHIAGTNGKGSVATKIAETFRLAGYKVGLYTSPHLSSFRERIRINGEMISKEAVVALLPHLMSLSQTHNISATFFELTTLLAFCYFAEQKVEIAILETGLGGRLDATNIVTPVLSVITSISLDHTEILGETLDLIATEKGGIIKEKIPVVIGPHVPLKPILTIAEAKVSKCIQVKENSPHFEQENRLIARAALEYLAKEYSLTEKDIEKGLEEKQPCRFEKIKMRSENESKSEKESKSESNGEIVLDVAHNPDGLKHLFERLAHEYPHAKFRFLLGLSKNKDVMSCLKLFAAQNAIYHLIEAENGRGASVGELSDLLKRFGVSDSRCWVHRNISDGVEKARSEAVKNHEVLVICGSFFIMGEVRKILGINEVRDFIDLNERGVSN